MGTSAFLSQKTEKSSGRKAKDKMMKRQLGYVPTVANTPVIGEVDAFSGASVSTQSSFKRQRARTKGSMPKNKNK